MNFSQRVKNALYRLRITLGQEHTRFNSKLYMELMHIERDYVLNLFDEATRLSAARLVDKRVVPEKVWVANINVGLLYTLGAINYYRQ